MGHELSLRDDRPILVVEDCDDDFDTVLEAARRAGVGNPLVRATDADTARSLLARRPAGEFAFVLLDYNLPGADGLALLEGLRRELSMAVLPAVVFTTSVNPLDRDAFDRAGANAFHAKSVQYDVCLDTLQAIFDRWLQRAPPPGAGLAA